jgi:predicted lipoprotein with Yx(FWY)xxD motif
MTLTRRTVPGLLAGAALVPALAAGGGGVAVAAAPHHATINVRSEGSLGKVLVDSSGRTLYLFGKDRGGRSACSGACAQNWPPAVVSGKPTSGSGVKASKLGTTTRSDGKRQVTYNGHPLYRFKGDTKAGQANGEGLTAFGGIWDVVSPAGSRVAARSSRAGSGGY